MDRNVFNNWLCPNSLLLPKKSESPKIGGGGGGGGATPHAPPATPLVPPARTSMKICGVA